MVGKGDVITSWQGRRTAIGSARGVREDWRATLTSRMIYVIALTLRKNNGTARCDSCWMKDEKRRAGSWRYAGCGETLSAKSEYSKWLCKRTSKKQDGAQKWNACYVENEEVTPKVPRGSWPCKRCGKVVERRELSAWLGRRKCKTKKTGTQRCNDCMNNAEMEEREQQRMNVEPVCKRARV